MTISRPHMLRIAILAASSVEYHRGSAERLRAAARRLDVVSALTSGTRERLRGMSDGRLLDWTFLNAHAFTSYGAHYRYERESIAGGDALVKAIAGEAARDARRQHWRALHIMNDWPWKARAP